MIHRPCSLVGAGAPVSLFPFPEGNGAHPISGLPEIGILVRKSGKPDLRWRQEACEASLRQTLAIGFARAPFGSGVMSPAPGAPPSLRSEVLRLPALHSVQACAGSASSTAVRGMSPREPPRRRPRPLETEKDRKTDIVHVFLIRTNVKSSPTGYFFGASPASATTRRHRSRSSRMKAPKLSLLVDTGKIICGTSFALISGSARTAATCLLR